MNNWTLKSRQIALDHPRFRFVLDTLERAGVEWPYAFIESTQDGVNVVVLTADDQIVLTRQYRHPIGQIIIDLPAGRVEPGESPEEAAHRELREETGYTASTWTLLTRFNPYPGSLKVTSHVFFARGLTPGSDDREPFEELEVLYRPFEEVYQEVLAGNYIDGGLQVGLLFTRALGLA
jgi:ADP-ribose pyrophosphatase